VLFHHSRIVVSFQKAEIGITVKIAQLFRVLSEFGVLEEQDGCHLFGFLIANWVGHVVHNVSYGLWRNVEIVGPKTYGEGFWVLVVEPEDLEDLVHEHSLFSGQTRSERLFDDVLFININSKYRYFINFDRLGNQVHLRNEVVIFLGEVTLWKSQSLISNVFQSLAVLRDEHVDISHLSQSFFKVGTSVYWIWNENSVVHIEGHVLFGIGKHLSRLSSYLGVHEPLGQNNFPLSRK